MAAEGGNDGTPSWREELFRRNDDTPSWEDELLRSVPNISLDLEQILKEIDQDEVNSINQNLPAAPEVVDPVCDFTPPMGFDPHPDSSQDVRPIVPLHEAIPGYDSIWEQIDREVPLAGSAVAPRVVNSHADNIDEITGAVIPNIYNNLGSTLGQSSFPAPLYSNRRNIVVENSSQFGYATDRATNSNSQVTLSDLDPTFVAALSEADRANLQNSENNIFTGAMVPRRLSSLDTITSISERNLGRDPNSGFVPSTGLMFSSAAVSTSAASSGVPVPSAKGTKWSQDEDNALILGIANHGKDWFAIWSEYKEVLSGRSGRAMEERYKRLMNEGRATAGAPSSSSQSAAGMSAYRSFVPSFFVPTALGGSMDPLLSAIEQVFDEGQRSINAEIGRMRSLVAGLVLEERRKNVAKRTH